MLQKGIEQMQEIFTEYFGGVLFPVLLAAVFLILVIRYRNREHFWIFGTYGILALFLLNPVTVGYMGGLTTIKRYIRIFWIFPFLLMTACCAKCLLESKKGWKRTALLLVLCGVLAGAGKPVLGEINFAPAVNEYKLPANVIEVPEAIESYKYENCDSPYVIATVYLSTYLRQYDGNIRLFFGRSYVSKAEKTIYRMMYNNMDKDLSYEEIYELGQSAIACGVDMIVLNKYQVMNVALDSLGFERIDATEDYYIFRYRKKE